MRSTAILTCSVHGRRLRSASSSCPVIWLAQTQFGGRRSGICGKGPPSGLGCDAFADTHTGLSADEVPLFDISTYLLGFRNDCRRALH
jgi:hypothetical protein